MREVWSLMPAVIVATKHGFRFLTGRISSWKILIILRKELKS